MDELKTRDDVKEWMMHQQLGRRNLSDVERYEIVQKFKSIIQRKAKENQSAGGKGLANLPKVNTRKVLANEVGISERTYSKLDKVMSSSNKEIKEKLRNKEISIDKAFKSIDDEENKVKQEIKTPKVQIEEIDTRISEIEKEKQLLQQEKEDILKKRKVIFESLDIQCHVKCRWENDEYIPFGVGAIIYIEYEGHKEVLYSGFMHHETPDELDLNRIPKKYIGDFLMVWAQMYQEYINVKAKYEEDCRRLDEEWSSAINDMNNCIISVKSPIYTEVLKAGFKELTKKYHPDNTGGSDEKMKELNKLKDELFK